MYITDITGAKFRTHKILLYFYYCLYVVFIILGYFILLMIILFTGLVPIHLAAIGNHPDIIAQLVTKGCDINTQVKYILKY